MRYLLSILLVLGTSALQAQTAIHRCVAADGTPVFTDQPCSHLDATVAATARAGDTRSAEPGGMCPATPAALKARIADAFNASDANALAGLMLWQGYGRGAALSSMRHLRSLVREPLVGFGAAADPGADASARPLPAWPPFADNDAPANNTSDDNDDANTLTLRLGGVDDGNGRQASFGIVPRAGCLWLRP